MKTLLLDDPSQPYYERGLTLVAGADEVGRGPLAGPVVGAAVLWPAGLVLPGLTDSKKLSAAARERLLPQIRAACLGFAVGVVDAAGIDAINIRRASLAAMRQAVLRLPQAPQVLLVDGRDTLELELEQQAVVKGDARVAAIAAASILAKVVRDRMMAGYDQRYPGYGFVRHAGYPVPLHLEALRRLGPCPIHRRSFGPVREVLACPSPS